MLKKYMKVLTLIILTILLSINIESNASSKNVSEVEDGTYEIVSAINNNIAFDITDGSNEDGAQIQLWQNVHAKQQQFTIKSTLDGYFTIQSKQTGKYLTIGQENPSWGEKVIQKKLQNTDSQKWKFKVQNDGTYNIISKIGNLNIDIPDWNCSNGVKLQLWGNNETATAQKFILIKQEIGTKNLEEGTYNISSAINSKISFDITDGSNNDGALIQLWENVGAMQQKFVLEYVDEGYYRIKSKLTDKYLTVENKNPGWGAKIVQKSKQDDETQQWLFKKQGKGIYNIISKVGNLNIDIPDWNCSNGIKLQLWGNNETATAQQFVLTKEVEEKAEKTVEDGNYRILSKLNTKQSFDIDYGSQNDGAKAQLWTDVNALQQKFEIKHYKDGYYKIISRNSNKVLSAESNNIRFGTPIVQKKDNNLDSQLWIIKQTEAGVYTFISKSGNLALCAESGQDGAKLVLGDKKVSLNNTFILINEEPEKYATTQIEDGYYNIKLTSNKVVDVKGASQEENANIQIWDRGAVQQQKFHIEKVENEKYYKISAVHSNKAIQVENSSIYIGANVSQGKYSNLENQHWYFIDCGNGYFNIVSKENSLYMSTVNVNQNAANIQMGYNNKTNNNKFKFEKVNVVEAGPFEIESKLSSNRVLDIDRGSQDNGANVQIWQPQNTNQERFIFEPITNDVFKIKNLNSGKVLTVEENGNVVQYEYMGKDNQQWQVIERGENYYSFKSKENGKCLDIDNASTANGTNVKVWDDNGNDAQKFKLVSGYRKFFEQGTYGTSGKRKANQGGHDLVYYKIGQGSKHLFTAFSIHGFEDSYYRDGQELIYIANQFKDYLNNNMPENLVNEWTIYIFPSLNPDGAYDGWTNNGPGRTTLYSYAPNNKGIDMNRSWSVGFQRQNGDRNYTGTEPFQAPESAQLRDFILNNQGSKNILIDTHGWLNETIGDNGIGSYYREQFGISNHIGSYGKGYFVNWARSIPNTRSMLLELPEVHSHSEVVNRNYPTKFINATLKMLQEN